jgi:hypothetical protein
MIKIAGRKKIFGSKIKANDPAPMSEKPTSKEVIALCDDAAFIKILSSVPDIQIKHQHQNSPYHY